MTIYHHTTLRIRLGETEVEIDAPLARIVSTLYQQGVITTTSCQGGVPEQDGGKAHIGFATLEDLKRFASLVTAGLDFWHPLSRRVYGEGPEELWWLYDAAPCRMAENGPQFTFRVLFDPEDIPLLDERLETLR